MSGRFGPATVRSNEWLESKAAVVLGFADLTLLVTLAEPAWSTSRIVVSFVLFTIALLGLAGLGYVVNDLADESSDRRAGVTRPVTDLDRRQRVVLLTVLVIMAFGPWVVLDVSAGPLVLLGLQVVLLLAYSLPPVRLKERGTVALLADMAFGYVVPVALTLSTFSRAGDTSLPLVLSIASHSWAAATGLHLIALHQYRDRANDEAAGIRTWATIRGESSTARWVGILQVIEILTFVGLVVVVGSEVVPELPLVLGLALAWQLAQQLALSATEQPARWSNVVIGQLATFWFPLTLAVALVVRHPELWPLVAIQLLVSASSVSDLLDSGLHRLRVAAVYGWARLGQRTAPSEARRRAQQTATGPTHVDLLRRGGRAALRRIRA